MSDTTRLIFSEHIKRNFTHKEKFYVGYDVFSFDRVENRLIKSTLLYLKNKSKEDSNKRDIRRMLLLFEDITPSQNYDGDFARCGTDRTVKDYADILLLCKVFLHKKSFTMYDGENDATALLFPMDRLFEQYIAKEMQSVVEKEWTLIPQSKGKYLFDGNHFSLRPDILLENKNDIDGKGNSKKIIIDTKWKRLVPDSSKHYGISQADMYQMYAYHTRLKHVEGVVVMYPYYEGMKEEKIPGYFVKEMDIQIHIVFFDLIKYIKCKKFKECIVGLTQLNVYEGRN